MATYYYNRADFEYDRASVRVEIPNGQSIRRDSDDFPVVVGRILYHPIAYYSLVPFAFVWRGGPYIDFGTVRYSRDAVPVDPNAPIDPDAVEIIDTFNVFDYQFDKLLIARTPEAFAEWLATFDQDDIDRVVESVA